MARVRKHRPSALLPLIARASATYSLESSWLESPYGKYTPWALADAARVSLAYGNEYRKDASDADLLQILDMYVRLEDHFLRDTDEDALGRVAAACLRGADDLPGAGVPGSGACCGHAHANVGNTPGAVSASGLGGGELLGTSLSHYVGIAQLLWASAISCAGRFDPESLKAPGAQRSCAEIPTTTILSVNEKHFVTDAAAFRQVNERARMTTDPLLRRYEYNPLRGTPLVKGYGPGFLAPVSQLIPAKASPLGIYYTGVARFGDAFAQDLGDLFDLRRPPAGAVARRGGPSGDRLRPEQGA
ncbi:hypothetical protein ACFYXD_37485 [Streptomyces platensis]|uniref:hypothetical protein n=1 Tax=Streptomyces platensis TaxID=58346 RepID=UPI0036B05ECD